MTVNDLINELKKHNGDLEVHLAYPAGDHWRTTLAPPVEYLETGTVKHSGYHGKDKLMDDEDEDAGKRVLILHNK